MKKYRKKNGFTLVELLAVIVILAVILAIAIPGMTGIVTNSIKASFRNDTKMVIKAIEYKMMSDDSFDPTIINATNISTLLGVSADNYQDVKVTRLKGQYKAQIIGKNKWSGYVVYGTRNNVGLSETTATVLTNVFADNSGASEPELATNMIPVVYYNGAWVKADRNNLIGTYSWYNYATTAKKWANAVTVSNASLANYKSADPGTPIIENDVLTYLVWIPRYKYAIPTGSGARSINIVFETSNTAKSTGTAIDTSYLTHPAFTLGTTELNGFWVGKFELTGSIGSITVKPNVASLRSQTVSSFYTAIRNMENPGNAYNFNANEVDTHMMLNNEWGAVAYLSMSTYGLNNEIYKNNSSSYITGRSGGNSGGSQVLISSNEYIDTGFYKYDGKCASTTTLAPGINASCTAVNNTASDTSLAFKASTTGTIDGVYDMSGGSWEYVMGNYQNYSGQNATYNSFFNGPYGEGGSLTTGLSFPENKYYNLYTTTNTTTACNGRICYGHALSETPAWYGDYASMIGTTYPWFLRGGLYSNTLGAGAFSFTYNIGNVNSGSSARLIVALTY